MPRMYRENPKVAVIGAGVAGAITAIRLAEQGIDTTLIEKGPDIINGPPMCHLHAGGNLYREISDEQCFALLRQSIDTIKEFGDCVNWRPTVIAVPERDPGTAEDLLPRLLRLQSKYADLIASDPSNEVLGAPQDYFCSFTRNDLERLKARPNPHNPQTPADWLVPVAKQLDLNKLQYPVYLVQEFGMSSFRLAATVKRAIERLRCCTLLTKHKVTGISKVERSSGAGAWQVELSHSESSRTLEFDFIVNAGGYKSGELDDMLGLKRKRMVEFKAAYLARWQTQGCWPEVIFHGERGAANGMSQLTPYSDGFFQLHGMSQAITLFRDGLAHSSDDSSQPKLSAHLNSKLTKGWSENDVAVRTRSAIEHAAFFIPQFQSAKVAGKPLFGAQQIPGDDPTLRSADVYNSGNGYVSVEIVKASSATTAADKVCEICKNYFTKGSSLSVRGQRFASLNNLNSFEIRAHARMLAHERGYPEAIAKVYGERPAAWASRKLS